MIDEVADLLEIEGANGFRIRAYRNWRMDFSRGRSNPTFGIPKWRSASAEATSSTRFSIEHCVRQTSQRKHMKLTTVMIAAAVSSSTAFIAGGQEDHSQHSTTSGQTGQTNTDESMHGMQGMNMNDMQQHGEMPHEMQGLYGAYSMTREASGTAWQPDASPMEGAHFMHDDWMFMLHGFAFGVYDYQSGHRGDRKFFSPNMLMGMAERPLGPGTFGLRTMLSLEPATIGRTGYPELLQTGETADGKTPLIDRQHPHDFFMELAATYSMPIGNESSAFAYFGYPGEPALGPATFMHRFSGMDNPEAPITHHWLDSTHITFGVATLGYVWKQFKIDGSIFTGRESDEDRWNFDRPRFDSYAARLTYNPTKAWSMQVSYGNIHSPEGLEPNVNTERVTASLSYHCAWAKNNWQTTFAWGRNIEHPGESLDGFLLESLVNFQDTHTVFGRAERVNKDDLFPPEDPREGQEFTVNKISLGYIYDFPRWKHVKFGLGGLGGVHILPGGLASTYGETPLSFMLFVRAKL
jgi:hypothetical protein